MTSAVTICDVGPRDGLQNDPKILEPTPARRALRQARRCGAAAGRGRQLRQPGPRSADGRRRGGRRRPPPATANGLCRAGAERPGLRAARHHRPRRDALRLRVDRDLQPAEPGRDGGRIDRDRRRARRAARREDGLRATVTIGTSFGCPFEGAVDPGRVTEIVAEIAEASPDEIVLADTIGVATPRRCPRPRRGRRAGSRRRSASISTTPVTRGMRTRSRHSKPGRACWTRRSAESGAAPSHPARPGTSRPKTSSTCSTARASKPGSISTPSSRSRSGWKFVLGRPLEGQVYRAGTFSPVAG